jgi:hypothetical protein
VQGPRPPHPRSINPRSLDLAYNLIRVGWPSRVRTGPRPPLAGVWQRSGTNWAIGRQPRAPRPEGEFALYGVMRTRHLRQRGAVVPGRSPKAGSYGVSCGHPVWCFVLTDSEPSSGSPPDWELHATTRPDGSRFAPDPAARAGAASRNPVAVRARENEWPSSSRIVAIPRTRHATGSRQGREKRRNLPID